MIQVIQYIDGLGRDRFFYYDPDKVPEDKVMTYLNLSDAGERIEGCLNLSEIENIVVRKLAAEIKAAGGSHA